MQLVKAIVVTGVTILFIGFNNEITYAANIENNATIDFNETSKYYTKATPIETEEQVIIKENPEDESKPVGIMSTGEAVEILRKDEEWTKIKSGEIEGWVKTIQVITGYDMEAYIIDNGDLFNRVGTVIDPETQLESEESTGEVIAILKENQEVKIIKEYEDYLYVKADDMEGYIPKDKVSESELEFKGAKEYKEEQTNNNSGSTESNENINPAVTNNPIQNFVPLHVDPNASNGYTPDNETEIRKGMVNYAMQFLGRPYVYGGTSLETGIDCSAFMQNIYRNFGISIPRTSRQQSVIGRRIDFSEIRPGDLLFYYDAGTTRVGHVTMYVGNNTVIHASNPRSGIILSSVSYRMPCWCVRVIEDEAPVENEQTVSEDEITKLESKFTAKREIGPGIPAQVEDENGVDVSNLLNDSITKLNNMMD